MSEQHDHRVIGGYKSALNNRRVSEETKQNTSNAIDNYENRGNEAAEDFSNEVDNNTHHSNRAVGGYKATLKNPKQRL
ncbi:conidiation-specific protein 6 [Cryptococcus gattii E566]|uniref:Conidiation-specific protein 6 n=1 Tax=Cryptococcus gattii EJB2 TaxID=1296103 RepID=A0ABR5BN15_9TREE|nr:conidiation-specific protein 6 [Cryptococcus gattii EJB2]KIY31532.1 conidiation-specific protein 6 [Cryptococcus gattii E566]KJE02126.1 conidiation-specific protein 6 [Cryptococcus gattii NT-10]